MRIFNQNLQYYFVSSSETFSDAKSHFTKHHQHHFNGNCADANFFDEDEEIVEAKLITSVFKADLYDALFTSLSDIGLIKKTSVEVKKYSNNKSQIYLFIGIFRI